VGNSSMGSREAAMSRGKREFAASTLQVRPQQQKRPITTVKGKLIDHLPETISSFKGGKRLHPFKIPIELTSY